jgi:hypothetical protein
MEFNAQQERDRANRVFGAVDRTGAYLGLPAQLNQQALQGRGQVFDFATAAQTQAQNEINAEIQAYVDSYNITDPQTLQVLSNLIAQRYGGSVTRGVTKPPAFDPGGAAQAANASAATFKP